MVLIWRPLGLATQEVGDSDQPENCDANRSNDCAERVVAGGQSYPVSDVARG